MKIRLEYGKDGLWIDVPDRNLLAVLDRDNRPAPADPMGVIERSLEEPIGCKKLSELARGHKTACVVISDVTRPIQNHVLLPPVLRRLEEAGIGSISILIGNGLHRPMTDEEIKRSVGAEIAAKYKVHNHFGRDAAANPCIGKTRRGTPVCIDKVFLDAEFRVITGLVEPHIYAGYSGGRKAIAIGIAALDTIRAIHSPDFLEDESLRSGHIDGNAFHIEACEIAEMARAHFCVNVTMNHDRKIIGAYSGDIFASHLAAVDAVARDCVRLLPQPADIVITTNAGYPADLNLYQSPKGLQSGASIVKPGGTVIFAAELCEGLGGSEFAQLILQSQSPEHAMERLTSPGFFVIDQWGLESICKALRKAEVMLFTRGLSADVVKRCFMTPIASVEEGIKTALQKHGPDAKIAVIPKGPYVVGTINGDGINGQESLQ